MLIPRAQHGATLIELMIAITLVAILLALGLPSFTQWLQNAQIRNAADIMLSGLQLARAEAVRRNALVEFVLTDTDPTQANVAAVAASTTGRNWMVRVFRAGGGQPAEEFIGGRPRAEGSPNAVINSGQATIVFNSLGRVTPVPGGNITINVTNPSGGNRPLNIVISPGGQIRMCDPNLPAGNVQSCQP